MAVSINTWHDIELFMATTVFHKDVKPGERRYHVGFDCDPRAGVYNTVSVFVDESSQVLLSFGTQGMSSDHHLSIQDTINLHDQLGKLLKAAGAI